MDLERLVVEMIEECDRAGQAVRTVPDTGQQGLLRDLLRAAARARALQIRTAVIESAVVVVRTDAAIWNDTTETMRRKLTPRD